MEVEITDNQVLDSFEEEINSEFSVILEENSDNSRGYNDANDTNNMEVESECQLLNDCLAGLKDSLSDIYKDSNNGKNRYNESDRKSIENCNGGLEENKMGELYYGVIPDNNSVDINENMMLYEIGRHSWQSDFSDQHYLRGCLWSPDGTCVLTAVNGLGMHIFELPSDIYEKSSISRTERDLTDLRAAVSVPESGTVYDYNWFPYMNSNTPSTCCWIASRQHEPIHMWDAFTGELRCTYRGYDQFDEVETAISTTFSPDGNYIIGGYKKSLKIFNTDIPGRDYTEVKSKNALSAIVMHYTHPQMLICGSWNNTINIFDIRATELGCLTTIYGHKGGITLLKVDATGEKLYSGARKDNEILEWDLRNFNSPLNKYVRTVSTNQRIYFDISPCNKYLFTGGNDGIIKGWNLCDSSESVIEFQLHNDCCNAVSFCKREPVMCTTAGQFKFSPDTPDDIINGTIDDVDVEYENSLVLWWYGKCDE